MYGYAGKILRVDLKEKQVKIQESSENFYRKFIGGVGVAAKIIFDEIDKETDPLSPENILVLGGGPYQSTKVPGSGKWIAASRSPLTGIWGEAAGGGNFGIMLRAAGFDLLVVKGRAEKPVYLWIHDGEVEIKDASKIWGTDTYTAIDKIKEEVENPRASVAAIGQAGENLVRMALICNDKHGFASRTGMGAVMGSKNLKAVATYGEEKPRLADPDRFYEFTRKLIKDFAKVTKLLTTHGTSYFTCVSYDFGNIPIKNWSRGDWITGICSITAPRYTDRILTGKIACPNCPAACHRHVKVEKPEKYKCEGAGPEYETLGLIGSNLMIDDVEAVAKINDLCNRYGVDTISTGSTIGVAMELYEKGIITENDTEGIKLEWGNADAVISLLHKIAKREGIGNVLAEGSVRAAKEIGDGAVEIVSHAKGLDYPAHDPRACNPNALNFATGNRGACHMRGFTIDMYQVRLVRDVPGITIPEIGLGLPPNPKTTWKGHAVHVIRSQDWGALFDSLVQCKFMLIIPKDDSPFHLTEQTKLLNYITGWDLTPQEFIKTGERIFNLQRAVNNKLGVSRKDDVVSPRSFELVHPMHTVPRLDAMLHEYYKIRKWAPDGKPTKEKLEELGLREVAEVLWK